MDSHEILSAIEQSSSIILITNGEGELVYVSPSFEKISGYNAKDVIGKNPRFLKTEDTHGYLYKRLWKTIKSGKPWTGRFKNKKKTGEQFWVRQTITPVFRNKKIEYFISIQDNISREIETEQQRNSLIKDLQRSNDELEAFARVISHDLKSHLHVISGLSSLIEEKLREIQDMELIGMLDMVRSRVEIMDNFIQGVLTHAIAGRNVERRTNFLSEEVINEVLDSIDIPSTIEISVIPKLPTIYYNRTLFSQILLNLVNNAIIHHGKANGKVEIFCEELAYYWKFNVLDDGVGIEENDYLTIFQLFGKGTHTRRNKTSGIGLSIVKKIVDQNGGTVEVDSLKGVGTTFSFTIPK